MFVFIITILIPVSGFYKLKPKYRYCETYLERVLKFWKIYK